MITIDCGSHTTINFPNTYSNEDDPVCVCGIKKVEVDNMQLSFHLDKGTTDAIIFVKQMQEKHGLKETKSSCASKNILSQYVEGLLKGLQG